jgi:hypothetical protein
MEASSTISRNRSQSAMSKNLVKGEVVEHLDELRVTDCRVDT